MHNEYTKDEFNLSITDWARLNYDRNLTNELDPRIIGFEHEGIFITQPFLDESARLDIDPFEVYGDLFLEWLDHYWKVAAKFMSSDNESRSPTEIIDCLILCDLGGGSKEEFHKQLSALQAILGQDDEGSAELFFEDEVATKWESAAPNERKEIVKRYLSYELKLMAVEW